MNRLPQSELRQRTAYLRAKGTEEGFVPQSRVRRKRDSGEFRSQVQFTRIWRTRIAPSRKIAPCLGYHIPNGSVMGGGKAEWQKQERAIRGRLQKLAGVTPGVVDYFIAVPAGRFHGLYLEFKAPGQLPTPDQEEFMGYALARGYQCRVCFSAEEAVRQTEGYLDDPNTGHEPTAPLVPDQK